MDLHYKYLIVGGGITADAAVRGIRDIDTDEPIGLISEETDGPYRRPWLSKGLWKDKVLDKVWLKTGDRGVDMYLGRRIDRVHETENRVFDSQGDAFTFDTLLLATGVRSRQLAPASDRIIAFRTIDDYRRLRELTQTGDRFAVIGSGFIGSEIAAALAMNGKQVDLIFPDSAIGSRLFPAGLADFITDRYRAEGVTVRDRMKVAGVTEYADRVEVALIGVDGSPAGSIDVDAVVSGIGVETNTELAESAGLRLKKGIVVDRRLRTSRPNIFAAGDVAWFYQPALRKHVRIEHENNAQKMGRTAGRAMAGKAEPYDHLPFFYSDLFDLGYEAVGEVDSRLEMTEDWSDRYQTGRVFYTRDGRVRGVLNWNVWDMVDDARERIAIQE